MIRFQDGATALDEADRLLAQAMIAVREGLGRPIAVGLCGAQGSGKSTTAARLAQRLGTAGRPTAVLSIDDFYLTLEERRAAARGIHPLLVTRGVPGTHDTELAGRTIARLLHAGAGEQVRVPSFDKTIDDRLPAGQWPIHRGPIDVVLLEGWCVGAEPQADAQLAEPVNALERIEDADGRWRRHVNAQLAGPYAGLFHLLDLRLFLRAPDFDRVLVWRGEQEAGLRRIPGRSLPAMDEPALARFIAHYERITRHLLAEAPADLIVEIGPDRVPLGWRPGRVGCRSFE